MTAECWFYKADGSPELTWITAHSGKRVGYQEPHYYTPDERYVTGEHIWFHCSYGLFEKYLVVDAEVVTDLSGYSWLFVLFQSTGEHKCSKDLYN